MCGAPSVHGERRRGARARGEGRMPPEKAPFAKESPTMRSTRRVSCQLSGGSGAYLAPWAASPLGQG